MNAMSAPQRVLLNVDQFHLMGQAGVFGPEERIELVEGELLKMPPIGSRHGSAVAVLNRQLFRAGLGERALLWPQGSLVLSQTTELQPDIVLLEPRPDDYRDASPRPDDVLLLIEVADSTLRYDRGRKAPLYARHGIREFWLLNVADRELEVHRGPGELGYATRSVLRPGAAAFAEAFPDVSIDWSGAVK
jgi:Uma2 family endonuclease